MKLTVMAATLTMLLAFVTPALAQAEKTYSMGAFAVPEGETGLSGSGIPDYEFEDGWVYIQGDIALDCPDFASSIDYERTPDGAVPAGVLRALDDCARAGLLSSSVAASVRASSNATVGGGGLPDTGGPALRVLLVASSVLLTTMVLRVRGLGRADRH